MQKKQQISTALTVAIVIVLILRFSGYREQIPSPLLWGLVLAQLAVSYLWKPQTP